MDRLKRLNDGAAMPAQSMNLASEISTIDRHEYGDVVAVWEASVRATHDFLTDERIEQFKPLILDEYLDAVQLACIRDTDGRIAGFVGVAGRKIEMLFVAPQWFRHGIGRRLLAHAENAMNASLVDVNEQNIEAVHFYVAMGYEVYDRSPVDGMGLPYPLLHLRLSDDPPERHD